MVACRLEPLGKAFVDLPAIVHYPRRLAVDGLPAHYLGAESLPDGLVAEADPRVGIRSPTSWISRTETPASLGVQGPGETTILSGWSAETSSGVTSSLRRTRTSAPSSPRYWTRLYVKES